MTQCEKKQKNNFSHSRMTTLTRVMNSLSLYNALDSESSLFHSRLIMEKIDWKINGLIFAYVFRRPDYRRHVMRFEIFHSIFKPISHPCLCTYFWTLLNYSWIFLSITTSTRLLCVKNHRVELKIINNYTHKVVKDGLMISTLLHFCYVYQTFIKV